MMVATKYRVESITYGDGRTMHQPQASVYGRGWTELTRQRFPTFEGAVKAIDSHKQELLAQAVTRVFYTEVT